MGLIVLIVVIYIIYILKGYPKMKILIACEYSGIVRETFSRKGHDAWSCDLLDTEISGKHYKGDVRDILYEHWDLMIAHPPCTYLSNAGARHLYKGGILNEERYKKGLDAKDFFMLFYNSKIEKVCIENPIPSKIYKLPEYTQVIQPYYFGEPFQKRTCLWLKGLPKLWYRKQDDLFGQKTMTDEAQSTKISGNWFNKGGADRQKNRAKTFSSIAVAMAEQWG